MSALFQLNKEFYERLTNRLVSSIITPTKDLEGINYLKVGYSASAGDELNPPQFICEGDVITIKSERQIDTLTNIVNTIQLFSNNCSCNSQTYQNEILFKLNLTGNTGDWQVIDRTGLGDYYLQINFGVPTGNTEYVNIFEFGYYDTGTTTFYSYFYIITPIICITETTDIFLTLNTTFELPPNCQ